VTAIDFFSLVRKSLMCFSLSISIAAKADGVIVDRLLDGPIIFPSLHESVGDNIQGPSLIRVPDWVESPLGKYYLYFADHKGDFIRLAYADQLTGPWMIYAPGSLRLDQTNLPQAPQPLSGHQLKRIAEKMKAMGVDVDNFPHDPLKELTTPHIASPDVHVDHQREKIVMYFHGLKGPGQQVTRLAQSNNGIDFEASAEDLGLTYMRAFSHQGKTYSMAMPGQFYRSIDGLKNFEKGPLLFNLNMRHAGLIKRGDSLFVFWTQVGHAPERILLSRIDISGPWETWKEEEPFEVLRPKYDWEGADAPLQPSYRSVAYGHVNQLRDPFVYEEAGRLFLLYVVAGESGIAISQLKLETP